jgi:hypothetical protein
VRLFIHSEGNICINCQILPMLRRFFYLVVLWFHLLPKTLKLFGFSILSILRVPDEDYSRNVSYALNLISTYNYWYWLQHCYFTITVITAILLRWNYGIMYNITNWTMKYTLPSRGHCGDGKGRHCAGKWWTGKVFCFTKLKLKSTLKKTLSTILIKFAYEKIRF